MNPYSLLVGALCEMLQLVAAPQQPVRIVHVLDRGIIFEEEDEDQREKCDSTTESGDKDVGASSSAPNQVNISGRSESGCHID